jgi:glyoxylase-like metal-dependent hydrolase (beta-lactamase superfamily II)
MPADLNVCLLGGSGPITLPLPAFLIEHDHGLVLFDTGLAPEAWDEGPRAVYRAIADMFPFECPPDNRLDRQIGKAGFQVEDVTRVVVSHAHIDHTGGLYLFPKARFYMSEEEMAYAFWPHPFFQGMFGSKDLKRVLSCKWNLLSTDLDLFGDGSIQILRTPGHTLGQTSLLVKLESRSFLLTGDAAHLRTNIEDGVPCPVDLDTISAYRSIQRIQHVGAGHGADIWVMHDPDDWKKFGTVSQPCK